MARPVSQMGSDLRRRTQAVIEAPHKARRQTLSAAGMAAKRVHQDRMRRDSGGDMRLSGVGKRGAKIGARFDVRDDTALIRANGPVPLVANPMPPHRIPKRRGQRARKRVVVIPGVGVRAWANHPGTRGKDTWNKAKPKARTAITREIGAHTDRVVRQAFRRGT